MAQAFCLSNTSHSQPSTRHFPHGAWSFSEWPQVHILRSFAYPDSLISASACSRQNRMSISRSIGEMLASLLALARAEVELAEGRGVSRR